MRPPPAVRAQRIISPHSPCCATMLLLGGPGPSSSSSGARASSPCGARQRAHRRAPAAASAPTASLVAHGPAESARRSCCCPGAPSPSGRGSLAAPRVRASSSSGGRGQAWSEEDDAAASDGQPAERQRRAPAARRWTQQQQQQPHQHQQQQQQQQSAPPWGPSPAPGAGLPPQQAPPPPGRDQFAAFRAFQQLAAQQQAAAAFQQASRQRGGFSAGGRPPPQAPLGPTRSVMGSFDDQQWQDEQLLWQEQQRERPGARLAAFRQLALGKLRKGWFAEPGLTCKQLEQDITRRADQRTPQALRGLVQALFMMLRAASSPEDMRSALSACVTVRGAKAAVGEPRRPLGGPRLALAFVQACVRCDAPDVLASGILRANEAGLVLSYNGVHTALMHWGNLQELHKVDQVLEAMVAGGLPWNTSTAYVAIRSAVNAGRQDTAEQYAARFTGAGVRLHDTSLRLLQLGRERAEARELALAAVSGASSPPPDALP